MGKFNRICEHDMYQGFVTEHLVFFDTKQHKETHEVEKNFTFNLTNIFLVNLGSKGLFCRER